MRDLRFIAAILERLGELDRRVAGIEFRGRVTDVDAATKRVRMVIGKTPEGEDVKSPWLPVAQKAGALKVHDLPSVGEQVRAIAASGDIELASVSPLHWSEGHEAPSDNADEKVLTFGDVRIFMVGENLRISVGNAFVDIVGDQVEVNAPNVVVNSPSVSLGGEGGPPVARVGDMVAVGAGSSAGLWPIVEGSSIVSAV